MTMYVQCKLEKGNRTDTIWIPEKFAVVNKVLKRQFDDGSWEDGWVVKETYNKKTEKQAIFDRDKAKYHRQATDI